jgi:hypothetical protein
MGIKVTSAAELRAALADQMESRVKPAVVNAQRMIVSYCFEEWELGKATWSGAQPNNYWSGQYRASVNISIGAPDDTTAPDNPGPWPIHPNPYPAIDLSTALQAINGLGFGETVYITNAVPYAQTVEDHTQIAAAASAFTVAHFQNFTWKGQIEASDIPF